MTTSEMVARLIVAKNGRDLDANIDMVIDSLCKSYQSATGLDVMPAALAMLDGHVERGVGLKKESNK